MAQHRETWSSRHASAPSITLSGAASRKDDGKEAHGRLEHRPDKSPTRQGNTAGRSGKRVLVERRGVEVLDVEANFFFKALLKCSGSMTSFQAARLLAFRGWRSEEIAHLKNAAASGEELGGWPLPWEG